MSTNIEDMEELRRSERLRNQGPDPPMTQQISNDTNTDTNTITNNYENTSNVHEIINDTEGIPHVHTDGTNATGPYFDTEQQQVNNTNTPPSQSTTPDTHKRAGNELERNMMLTLTDSESVTSNISAAHRSSETTREQHLERQIQMLMNTVNSLTHRLDAANTRNQQQSQHSTQSRDNHDDQQLRNHIENSVLRGIQRAAETHRDQMTSTRAWDDQNTTTVNSDISRSRTSAPDPPGIRSPKKQIL